MSVTHVMRGRLSIAEAREEIANVAKDVRMRHLETGAQPENTAPDDGTEFDPHPEDDTDDEESGDEEDSESEEEKDN